VIPFFLLSPYVVKVKDVFPFPPPLLPQGSQRSPLKKLECFLLQLFPVVARSSSGDRASFSARRGFPFLGPHFAIAKPLPSFPFPGSSQDAAGAITRSFSSSSPSLPRESMSYLRRKAFSIR